MKKESRGIHLIAELASVSIGTVDRALHGRGGIKESTRERILEIARRIGYTPNLAARALSVARADIRIGVCMPREFTSSTISYGVEFWMRPGGWRIWGSNSFTALYRSWE